MKVFSLEGCISVVFLYRLFLYRTYLSIKMYLNETCKQVGIGKYLCDSYPIQNRIFVKLGDTLTTLLLNYALVYAIR
jgi:hypothetical protein